MKIKTTAIHLFFIILITSLVYINILQNEFVWDDNQFILDWQETKSFGNTVSLLKGSTAPGHGGVYRPLRGIFYAISYKLWKLNPVGYHVQSILVHLSCTMLVYLIAKKIIKNKNIAFMSSLLFGVHPIHTEAITFITASFDIIGVIFFLGSFYLYLKAQSNEHKRKLNYILSVICALIAFFSYELALTLPLLIILHDLCFNSEKSKIRSLFSKKKIYSAYVVSAALYLFIRLFVLDIPSGRGNYLADSFYLTMLAMTKAFVRYMQLLLFPVNLSINHTVSGGILAFMQSDVNLERVTSQSIFNLDVLFSIALIAFLIVIAVKSFKKHPLISFSIAWFFIALLPVSNILPQFFILAEKYLYIPSFGFCLLLSFMINKMHHIESKKEFVKYLKAASIMIFILTIVFYSTLTISRNREWKDRVTFWSKAAEQAPESMLAHTNLGQAYYDKGKLDLAIEEQKKAIAINPNYAKPYYYLGNSYYEKGEIELAIEQYQIAATSPNFPDAHYRLGEIYISLGMDELAIEEYEKAAAEKSPS